MRASLTVPIVALTSLLCACSAPDKPGGAMPGGGKPTALAVTVVEVHPTQVAAGVEAVGQTEGAREIEVRAQVGGILQKRLYLEGQPVKAGQALFQIDRAPFEIALAQARGQLAEQQAKTEQTAREAQRLKGLAETRAISQREADDAASALAQAQAALQTAQAKVREAALNLSYTTVAAPVAGISGRAVHSEGTLVGTSDNLLTTLIQPNPIWVRFSLSETELAHLPEGRLTPAGVRGVELLLPDGTRYPEQGRINFAAAQIDPKLGTLQLRAEFANPAAKLLPGQFVRARLLGGERHNVFLVPQGAVQQSEQGRFVFVAAADGTAQARPVATGDWHGQDWVILDGLKDGDQVIVDNLLKLRPGAPVTAHPPAAPGGK
ncbi:MAG: efflux RND transporter periplasmic adaptor subunit [Sulfuricella sp.]|nr:efflux RND transporter periplasmic adaptor subunit [Sulfuricella sp.]